MNVRPLTCSLALVVLLTSCGDPPSTSTDTASGGGETVTAAEQVRGLGQTLAGLDSAARRERLVGLARAEAGVATLYTSMTTDDARLVLDTFRQAYDLNIELYRANSAQMLQRVLQEAEAGFSGADIVLTNALEMQVLADEQLLLPLETPATADIIASAVYPTWAGVYVQTFVAAWNTELLSEEGRPGTWEEVLTGYPSGFAMELGDFEWFATLVQDYFVGQLGYEEAGAIDLFNQAARNATMVDGHTLMTELLAAGEFDLVASAYQARVGQLMEKGAPIGWEAAVEPLVVRPNGTGIYRDTDMPATAMLFVDFLLTDAQTIVSDVGRTPASMTTPGGLPPGYSVIAVDVEGISRDREKWETLYSSIVDLTGDAVID
jgi:iron(III) transport system substrate-binding protein